MFFFGKVSTLFITSIFSLIYGLVLCCLGLLIIVRTRSMTDMYDIYLFYYYHVLNIQSYITTDDPSFYRVYTHYQIKA